MAVTLLPWVYEDCPRPANRLGNEGLGIFQEFIFKILFIDFRERETERGRKC